MRREIWIEVWDGGLRSVSIPESMTEDGVEYSVKLIDFDWPDDAEGLVEIDGMNAVVSDMNPTIRKGE